MTMLKTTQILSTSDEVATMEYSKRNFRMLFFIASLVGMPASFAVGFIASKNFIFLRPPQTATPIAESSVPEGYAEHTCAHYALKNQLGDSENAQISNIQGFAFSQTDVWCVASLEPLKDSIGEGSTIQAETKWFRLRESRELSQVDISKHDFDDAVELYRTNGTGAL